MTEKRKKIAIVGGGLAGLSAALQIASDGGDVVLIESQKYTGGNSAKAVSGINGCMTLAQEKRQIQDSFGSFYNDTVKAGQCENDEKLVKIMIGKSNEAFEFLAHFGVELDQVNLGGGHSVPRTHCLSSPKLYDENVQIFGTRMMKTLYAKVNDFSRQIRVMTSTKAEELLVSSENEPRVVGVRVNLDNSARFDIKADAVILATGGFCSDHSKLDSLLTQFRKDLEIYPSTNGAFADGSGIKMALKIGARVRDMNKVQLHPTGFIDPNEPKSKTKLMCPEALRGFGGILVNKEGYRFANELDLRENFVALIEKCCQIDPICGSKIAFLIVNDEIIDNFGRTSFEIYVRRGLMRKTTNLEELCQISGIRLENMKNTVIEANECFNGERVDRFGRSRFSTMFDPDRVFFFCQTTPCIHYTFGGLVINEHCQILGNDVPFEGLYAAGEIVGGIHGAERLSGNSLLECVVFGRLAALESMTA